MHRVFRETITPRVGNLDQVHGFVFDLLKLCREKQGIREKLDVLDVIFHELWFTIIDQRAPTYGPYIMKLIYATWAKYHNGARLDQVHEGKYHNGEEASH